MTLDYEPRAASHQTVTQGRARFTVLTDRMIRMEYAADGVFEDRATLKVVNRRMPKVDFKTTTRGKTLTIRTGAITLEYKDTGRVFSRSNLKVTFKLGGKNVTWTPGRKDRYNLKGTTRTLDQCNGKTYPAVKQDAKGNWYADHKDIRKVQLCEGLISRSGWALVDDTDALPLNELDDGRQWVAARRDVTRRDEYLLAYGHDYKDALRDGAQIFGRQPLPPRYTLGYWWSRYWAYTDKQLEGLIERFNQEGVPLDVLVVDMDWHLEGWTGYTWDRRYFPDPQEFLQWCHDQRLRITLNLHPANGVGKHEQQFEDMCKAMDLDAKTTGRVDFDCTDPQFIDAYFKHLHHPHEADGVDFWWMDWQQGENTKLPGLDPLPWLNHLHWQDQERRDPGKRPLFFSRFGGLGAGRYPVGFSGDTCCTWESLDYQPYFTATASNVLYGYWSHDLGGHMGGEPTPEMYTRWVQFGIYSPIVRTHCSKDPSPAYERRFFAYDDPYGPILMDTVRERYRLAPYIYSENRRAVDTGVSLLRPMYYEDPDCPEAYDATGQYYFGREIIVAPITQPVGADEMAEAKVYLPKGKWWDVAIGDEITGGRWITRRYLLSETPVFIRSGAVIPGQQDVMRLDAACYEDLRVTVYPGRAGHYDLYEDDGYSQRYLQGESASVPMSHTTTRAKQTITIGKARGTYRGFKATRSLEIRLPGTVPPQDVRVGKRSLQWSYRLGKTGWTYDAATATTIIRLDRISLNKGVTIVVTPGKTSTKKASQLKGILSRWARISEHVHTALGTHIMHPDERFAVDAAQAGNVISREPDCFTRKLRELTQCAEVGPTVIRALRRKIRKHTWDPNKAYKLESLATAARILKQSQALQAKI